LFSKRRLKRKDFQEIALLRIVSVYVAAYPLLLVRMF